MEILGIKGNKCKSKGSYTYSTSIGKGSKGDTIVKGKVWFASDANIWMDY